MIRYSFPALHWKAATSCVETVETENPSYLYVVTARLFPRQSTPTPFFGPPLSGIAPSFISSKNRDAQIRSAGGAVVLLFVRAEHLLVVRILGFILCLRNSAFAHLTSTSPVPQPKQPALAFEALAWRDRSNPSTSLLNIPTKENQ